MSVLYGLFAVIMIFCAAYKVFSRDHIYLSFVVLTESILLAAMLLLMGAEEYLAVSFAIYGIMMAIVTMMFMGFARVKNHNEGTASSPVLILKISGALLSFIFIGLLLALGAKSGDSHITATQSDKSLLAVLIEDHPLSILFISLGVLTTMVGTGLVLKAEKEKVNAS